VGQPTSARDGAADLNALLKSARLARPLHTNSTHYIQLERPRLVTHAIRSITDQTRP